MIMSEFDPCKLSELFKDVIQPPRALKNGFATKLLAEWAIKAMIDDVMQVIRQNIDKPDCTVERLELWIGNKRIFVNRESMFPEYFLPDVVSVAVNIIDQGHRSLYELTQEQQKKVVSDFRKTAPLSAPEEYVMSVP